MVQSSGCSHQRQATAPATQWSPASSMQHSTLHPPPWTTTRAWFRPPPACYWWIRPSVYPVFQQRFVLCSTYCSVLITAWALMVMQMKMQKSKKSWMETSNTATSVTSSYIERSKILLHSPFAKHPHYPAASSANLKSSSLSRHAQHQATSNRSIQTDYTMSSSTATLSLFRTMLRESKKVDNYNFRLYAVRRVKLGFELNRSLTGWASYRYRLLECIMLCDLPHIYVR